MNLDESRSTPLCLQHSGWIRHTVIMRKNKPNKNYQSKNHSKFILTYHIIFTCKYRKKLLIKYGEDIKQIMFDISKKYDFEIKEMEVDKDHIHMMISSVPKISPLQIVRVLKQQSTIQMWRRYASELKKQYWKENTFWTDGYFLFNDWRSKQ